MSPQVSFTKTTLSYPPYAAEFDPYNRGYLVIGGGGGEGRSGVKNKITLLDISVRAVVRTIAEIELTSDEDAVMSLASLASKDGLIAFAGINSSEADRLGGRNHHLRIFKIDYPLRGGAEKEKQSRDENEAAREKISFLGKKSIFTPPSSEAGKRDTYQRILRLSPAQRRESGSKRIGAIATGLAPRPELVIFNATTSSPDSSDIIQRIEPPKEVNDLDILETEESNFSVAYCTDREVYLSEVDYNFNCKQVQSITNTQALKPLYSIPHPDVFDAPARPTIRALRFLTRNHLLLLCNFPNRKGAELCILKLHKGRALATLTQQTRLPSHVKAGAHLDTCPLDADVGTGQRQILVAVAGQDSSICIYTLHYPGFARNTFSKFQKYTVLRNVHPLQITKLTFSPFHSPWTSGTSPENKNQKYIPGPKYVRLASTSLANTVVIDTIPLSLLNLRNGSSRYALQTRSETLYTSLTVLVVSFILLVTLLLFQSFLSARAGSSGSSISLIPDNVRRVLSDLRPPGDRARPHTVRSAVQDIIVDAQRGVVNPLSTIQPVQRIKDLVHLLRSHPPRKDNEGASPLPVGKAVIVRVGSPSNLPSLKNCDMSTALELSTELLSGEELLTRETKAGARRWEELSKSERLKWKERLVRAGLWAVEEGEAVLRGVLFGELAGVVGGVAQEALGV